jgi:hypothetical protein
MAPDPVGRGIRRHRNHLGRLQDAGRSDGTNMRSISRRYRPGMWLLLSCFLLTIAVVNPLRETGTWSDDFSYARMVHQLLETGEYKVDHWAAADMPVQIYWAAGLSGVLGYSFITLRISTLILLLAGLVACYQLLRDFGSDDPEAGLLSLTLLASPLVLFLGFTYMTDVQFLSWMLIAYLFYTRGIRQHSFLPMALGSAAAAAAIGTRQFGVALPIGLVATWLTERARVKKSPLYLVGLLLPAFAAIRQASLGLSSPSFSQAARLVNTSDYLHQGLPGLSAEVLNRLAVLSQYMGLFLLPLAPVLAYSQFRDARPIGASGAGHAGQAPSFSRRASWFTLIFVVFTFIYIISFCFVSLSVHEALHRAPMPSLGWLLKMPGPVRRASLTLATTTAAVLLGWLLSRRYLAPARWPALPREELLLAFTSMAMIALNLAYAQFCDTYLITYIPFMIVAVGQESRAWPRWCRGGSLALCAVMLLLSTLWTRSSLAEEEAYWQAAEALRSAGVEPRRIAGDFNWSGYHGAFDDWIAEAAKAGPLTPRTGSDPRNPIYIHYAFDAYLRRRGEDAEYTLQSRPPETGDPSRQVVKVDEYRGFFLDRKKLYVVHRTDRR